MGRLLRDALAVAAILGAPLWAGSITAASGAPDPGRCGQVPCPIYTCFGPCGVPGCVCVYPPGDLPSEGGSCFGLEMVPPGWRFMR